MLAKFKRKSDRARNALRRMFRSPSPESPVAALEYTSWDGLQLLVQSLSEHADEFSLLTPAISRLSAYVKVFNVQARTRPEYSQLGVDMDELFSRLANHASSPWSSRESHGRIAPFAQFVSSPDHDDVELTRGIRSLDHEIDPLIKFKEIYLNAEQDIDTNDLNEVLRRYRRIRTLFAMFLVSAKTPDLLVAVELSHLWEMCESLAVWKQESDEEHTTRLDSLLHVPRASYLYTGPDAIVRVGCMPHTREDMLKDLHEWVHYGKSQNIRWLTGSTGAGKTAVVYSPCDYLKSTGKPFASFFGSRQIPACRDVKRVLPSISHQLAQQSLPFRCAVSLELVQGLEVLHMPITEQFKKLTATPLSKVGHTFSADPVIVIDGIEECDDKDEIYQVLRTLVEQAPALPLKLLISILPSRTTHKFMRGTPGERHMFEPRLHELDSTIAQADIRTYLAANLEDLTLSRNELNRLAQRSGTSFVYATAVVRYLHANSSGQSERLQWFLEVPDPAEPGYHRDPEKLCSHLAQILLHDEHLEELQRSELIRLLHAASHPAAPSTLNITAGLLEIDFASHEAVIYSLLLPALSASGVTMVSLIEPFVEYLQTHALFNPRLYPDLPQVCTQLARGCFSLILSVEPAFNICDLESSYLLDHEVPYLREQVVDSISPELLYACCTWATHMTAEGVSNDIVGDLGRFLSTRLLLWMEILNLKRCVRQGVEMVSRVRTWAQVCDSA
ncbi:hypothetical protein FRC12_000277 [Ceratobasidium sp. 428]|nr:hypothetical protein FRC12_000277 [Ceratobasidium sp. 428]